MNPDEMAAMIDCLIAMLRTSRRTLALALPEISDRHPSLPKLIRANLELIDGALRASGEPDA